MLTGDFNSHITEMGEGINGQGIKLIQLMDKFNLKKKTRRKLGEI